MCVMFLHYISDTTTGHVLIWDNKLAYCTEFDQCLTAILHSELVYWVRYHRIFTNPV